MKISELKQPYRRMAEYLAERNINPRRNDKTFLLDAFDWDLTNDLFWDDIDNGNYPEITEEIKQHFPSDFDFSGEEEKSFGFAYKDCDSVCNFYCTEGGRIEPKCINERYTKLAKEGKFDELPDTCEFSESVELEVWDDDGDYLDKIEISGKYKGYYIDCTSTGLYSAYQHAQLPTKKIDFTQFQTGDVVEVELVHNETKLGWFDFTNENHLYIRILKRQGNQTCNGGSCAGTKIINKEKIKSITKIK